MFVFEFWCSDRESLRIVLLKELDNKLSIHRGIETNVLKTCLNSLLKYALLCLLWCLSAPKLTLKLQISSFEASFKVKLVIKVFLNHRGCKKRSSRPFLSNTTTFHLHFIRKTLS